MKKIIFSFAGLFLWLVQAEAQITDPGKKARQASENRVNNKVDRGIDKGLDKIEEGIDGLFRKKKKKDPDGKKKEGTGSTPSANNTGAGGQVTGVSDFVPGSTVIFSDDFSKDAVGDFPAQWNTNGSGTIVTIEGLKGRWLSVVHNSVINPVINKALPENATIEFDLGHTDSDGSNTDNLKLSQKRAAAVKMYITENFAVAGSRIQIDGKGESMPVVSNNTPEGKSKNRRVEFVRL